MRKGPITGGLTRSVKDALRRLEVPPRQRRRLEVAVARVERSLVALDGTRLVLGLDSLSLWFLSLDDPLPAVPLMTAGLQHVAGALERAVQTAPKKLSAKASRARKKFAQWLLDTLEAHTAFEGIDGYITSPFHQPLREDEVRVQVRNSIVALTKGAKRKLIKKLQKRAREKRAAGQANQADAFDWAADEVEKSLS